MKYRDTGDDILMEVVREFDYDYTPSAESLLTGRDMIGKAKIYVSLNRNGNIIRIRSADEAKSITIELLRGLLNEKARLHKNNHGQIKIVSDPRDGRIKINAFINPDSFAWKKDYLVDNLWNAAPTIAQSPAQMLPRDVPPSIIPHIATALETGSATFKLPHSAKKTKAIAAYVAKRGLSISVDGDNASLKKIA